MKVLSLYIFLFFITLQGHAADSLRLIRSIPVAARLLSSDPLGNIYLVKENNTLLKLNNKGDSIGIFNEIKKGKITQIDAGNPLRILLLFADYNQVVILNNVMTQKAILRLNSIGLNKVSCIANSADGSIWLYDQAFGTLLKVDEQLDLLQTTNLRNIEENPLDPCMMSENERSLYIADTTDGIRKFDQFGFYNTTYRFKTDNFQIFNTSLVYFNSPFLYSYNVLSFTEKKIELPDGGNIISVRTERNSIYVLRTSQLDIYELAEMSSR